MSTPSNELIIVDTTVADYQTLIAGIDLNTPIIFLHPDQNGLGEIEMLGQILSNYHDLDAIHLVTEGRNGALLLRDESLNSGDMNAANSYISGISSALKTGGDLMLYGCSVAGGDSGQTFVNDLHTLLGDSVDIAASIDKTGPTALGGDWDLEWQSGTIETVLPFSLAGMQDISHCLGCTGTDGAYDTFTATIIGTDGTTQWAHWAGYHWIGDVALTVNGEASPRGIGQEIGIDSNSALTIRYIAECNAPVGPTVSSATYNASRCLSKFNVIFRTEAN